MPQQSVVNVLKFGSALVVGFGILIALAAHPGTAGPAHFLLDLITWPVDGVRHASTQEMRLLGAVSGGVMVGWGILLWQLSTRLYAKDPELAKSLILTSIVAWFLVDSSASIFAGVPLNAVLNISFLFVYGWPLLRAQTGDNNADEVTG